MQKCGCSKSFIQNFDIKLEVSNLCLKLIEFSYTLTRQKRKGLLWHSWDIHRYEIRQNKKKDEKKEAKKYFYRFFPNLIIKYF